MSDSIVIIPTYNEKENIEKIIRAVLALGQPTVNPADGSQIPAGHQFNIVDTATLLDAQKHPDQYRDLLVRVAGYSDYFNDMTAQLQNEIIARTQNEEM